MLEGRKVWYIPGSTSIVSVQDENGLCLWGKQTHEEVVKEYPGAELLPWEEVEPKIIEAQTRSFVKPIEETTEETFYNMLECLPPMKWDVINGVEMFRMEEATAGNIRAIYCSYKGKYYYMQDRDTVTNKEISKRVTDFVKK